MKKVLGGLDPNNCGSVETINIAQTICNDGACFSGPNCNSGLCDSDGGFAYCLLYN